MKHQTCLIIDSSENSADLYYRTNFFVPDPIIFIEHRGEKMVVLNELEIDRGKRDASVDKVLSFSEYSKKLSPEKRKKRLVTNIVDLIFKELKVRSVLVPGRFPTIYTDELRKLGYGLRFKQKEPFFEERLKKRPKEIKFIRDSLRDTSKAMAFARRMLSTSTINKGLLYLNGGELTSERIKGEINSFLSLLGYSASHTIVSCGIYSSMPHHTGEGTLLAGKPIVIDIFPRSQSSGYYGDMTRTYIKGEPSKELAKLYRAVLSGQKLGISLIRAGIKVREVHQAIVEYFTKSGFKTGVMDEKQQGFIHSTGHGLGLEIHEPPRIGLGEEILEEGNVVTVEPGLYYEKIGGVRIEDVVVVKKKGCLNLTRYPKKFKV